jgi:hypothetical protein
MDTATEVKNVLIPIASPDGWLVFKYSIDDKEPWKWPKVLKYQKKFYNWMSWNSDSFTVNYKEISENLLATIVKKR